MSFSSASEDEGKSKMHRSVEHEDRKSRKSDMKDKKRSHKHSDKEKKSKDKSKSKRRKGDRRLDFVHGHFRVHAQEIVAACKAYVDGAQVGCLVKGRVQAVNDNSSSSQDFKSSVVRFLPSLVNELTQIGAHGL